MNYELAKQLIAADYPRAYNWEIYETTTDLAFFDEGSVPSLEELIEDCNPHDHFRLQYYVNFGWSCRDIRVEGVAIPHQARPIDAVAYFWLQLNSKKP